jgi:hypothetical protein
MSQFTPGRFVRLLQPTRGVDPDMPDTRPLMAVPGVLGRIITPRHEGEISVRIEASAFNGFECHFSPAVAEEWMELLPEPGRITAKPTSYSSVVGAGILLEDANGKILGQLGVIGVGGGRADQEAMQARLVAAINAGQAESQVRHYKRAEPYDVVASEALFQVSEPDASLVTVMGADAARLVEDGAKVVVYRNPEGMYFVRVPDEVVEPRFTRVP